MDDWVAAECPKAAVSKNSRRARAKSPNTIATIRYLFDGHVRPRIGGLRVDRTKTGRVEQVFHAMADAGYATSTIDHAWTYMNQACLYALRRGVIKSNPAADGAQPGCGSRLMLARGLRHGVARATRRAATRLRAHARRNHR
jgi:hypothetical protein